MRTIRCSSRLGGVVSWVGVVSGGVCLGGVHPHDTPLWTEFLTHAYENITFPQLLLQTIKIVVSEKSLDLKNVTEFYSHPPPPKVVVSDLENVTELYPPPHFINS